MQIAGLNIISSEGNVLQAAKCNSAHHSSVVCHSGMSIDRRGLEIWLQIYIKVCCSVCAAARVCDMGGGGRGLEICTLSTAAPGFNGRTNQHTYSLYTICHLLNLNY